MEKLFKGYKNSVGLEDQLQQKSTSLAKKSLVDNQRITVDLVKNQYNV